MTLLAEWIWRPWASPLHIFAGVGVVGLLAVIAYARTMRQRPLLSTALLAVRLAVIAALAVVLMGPSDLPPPADANVRPKLTVLLDRSGSMQTADCP